MSTTPTQRSWHRIRTHLHAARDRAGLTRTALAKRTRISRTTLLELDEGSRYSRIDTALHYAHAVGLDIAAVPPHLANLLDLELHDIIAILRAAQAAADGHRLNPLQARKINEILTKVITRPQDRP
jgi:DNA-binding XRE family transcriptional regulator